MLVVSVSDFGLIEKCVEHTNIDADRSNEMMCDIFDELTLNCSI